MPSPLYVPYCHSRHCGASIMERKSFGDAIVIGGSMAGLLAARVLADYFKTVTVIERDEPCAKSEARRCVPQGRHAHGLLLRGQDTICRLFRDVREELLARRRHAGQHGPRREVVSLRRLEVPLPQRAGFHLREPAADRVDGRRARAAPAEREDAARLGGRERDLRRHTASAACACIAATIAQASSD